MATSYRRLLHSVNRTQNSGFGGMSFEPRAIPSPRSPLLQAMAAYWEHKRGGRTLPWRRDLDPREFPRALPHLYLVDVVRGETLRFRVRLAGTFIESALNQRLTGAYLEDVKLDGATSDIAERYQTVVQEFRPLVSDHQFINEDRRTFDYERLLVPLAVDDADRADMILGVISFEQPVPSPFLSSPVAWP